VTRIEAPQYCCRLRYLLPPCHNGFTGSPIGVRSHFRTTFAINARTCHSCNSRSEGEAICSRKNKVKDLKLGGRTQPSQGNISWRQSSMEMVFFQMVRCCKVLGSECTKLMHASGLNERQISYLSFTTWFSLPSNMDASASIILLLQRLFSNHSGIFEVGTELHTSVC
jgi:hypothetical protein